MPITTTASECGRSAAVAAWASLLRAAKERGDRRVRRVAGDQRSAPAPSRLDQSNSQEGKSQFGHIQHITVLLICHSMCLICVHRDVAIVYPDRAVMLFANEVA